MKTFSLVGRKVSLWLLAVGLALSGAGLVGWGVGAKAPVSHSTGQGSAPQKPSITNEAKFMGTITYSGPVTGTHNVWIGAFTSAGDVTPVYSVIINGPGPYILPVGIGGATYYIKSGMDVDNSGGPPDPAVDPLGAYVNNPVTICEECIVTGVNITLVDPPPPTGSISGLISYTGKITSSHNLIIIANRQGVPGPPAYYTVIGSVGSYTMSNVADGTYNLAAYMDLGNDMGPPQPGEPFGWYDPGSDQQPDPVTITGGNAVTNIDITLLDTLRYIYLPSIQR